MHLRTIVKDKLALGAFWHHDRRMDDNVNESVADRLKVARAATGLSHRDVSAKMNACGVSVSHTTIGRLENGKMKKITSAQLYALADVLGVSPTWLAFGDGPMKDSDELHSAFVLHTEWDLVVREALRAIVRRCLLTYSQVEDIGNVLAITLRTVQRVDQSEPEPATTPAASENE